MDKKQYSLFIGRWQNFHAGHEWLFKQRLDLGKNIWIAIRDVEADAKNPKQATEILEELKKQTFIIENKDRIFISIIPDIESVNYGRGVGYEVIEHIPPAEVHNISGTKIRAGLIDREGNDKK
jgi:phosphopantetheine adenylyltransferase